MRSIAAGAAGILGPMAGFGQGILTEGLKAASSFEQTTVEMQTMIGSAKETQDTLGRLTKFAVDTPFEMPQLLSVSKELITFGERGDEMMDTIKMLGDASGGTASKFGLLSLVFNQIRGAGKLMTQDFRQLSTRGIISLQDIAKHYGVTTTAAQKMLTNGKIGFDDFRKILKGLTGEGGRFENMMKKQSTTLGGLTSTLNDSLNIAKRTLATPLVPFFKQLTSLAIVLANAIESTVRNGGDFISFAFAGATAAAALGAAIYGCIFAANLFGITMKKAIIGTGIGIAIIAIGAALGYLFAYLSQSETVLNAFAEGWAKVKQFFQPYVDAFYAFVAANQDTFAEIQALFSEVMTNIEDGFANLFASASGSLGGIIPSVDDVVGAMQFVVDTIRDIMDWLSLMTTNWSLTWELMKTNTAIVLVSIADQALMMFNTMIAAAMGAGMAIWSIMNDMWENILVIFSAYIQTIKGLWKGLYEAIKAALSGEDIWDSFQKSFVEEIAKIRDGGKNLTEIGGNAADAFTKTFVDKMGADSPLKGTLDTLKEDKERIKTEMVKDRETKREERAKNAAKEKTDKDNEDGRPTPAADTKAQQEFLKAGRYSFQDVGTKIQDSFLKDEKGDTSKKQLEVAQAGLAKQDELIKVSKDNKPKPTLS